MNLNKAIRKHIRGKLHRVAAICPPSIADLALLELRRLGFEAELDSPGVLVFLCKIESLYRLHLQSRLITSFRIRLAEFRCATREDLFRKLRRYPWEYWFGMEAKTQLKLISRSSAIQHQGRALRSAEKAIHSRLQEMQNFDTHFDVKPSTQKVYLYLADERCQLSIDASGESLYKRGITTGQGMAPLRETLAAAILSSAPFPLQPPFLDAMAGSGAFLTESLLSYFNISPLPRRNFAFEHWRVFNPKSLATLIRHLGEENRKKITTTIPLSSSPLEFIAIEQDAQNFGILRSNLANLNNHLNAQFQSPSAFAVQCYQADVFDWIQKHPQKVQGTILWNPAYGWRLEASPYQKIWKIFENNNRQGIVLLPTNTRISIPSHIQQRISRRTFPHGGKKITALYIKRSLQTIENYPL